MDYIIPHPKTSTIAITGKCNLKCQYCFYADEMEALNNISTAMWLSTFEELANLRVMRITITGGEPLTHPDLFELIDGVIANRMRYSIISNGTLFDERILEKFEVGKRRQRLDRIQISIDGSTAEVHNRSRPKSFEWAIRGLKLLKEANFPLTVRVTITPHNVDDLENIAALLLEEVGLYSFSTNDASELGAGCENQKEVVLSVKQQLQAMKTMSMLAKRYPDRLSAQAGPQARVKLFDDMEQSFNTGARVSPSMGFLSSCGAPFLKLDMLHDGTIVPCHMISKLHLGNVKTDSLEDIWFNHPDLQALRMRRFIPMHEVSGCEGCKFTQFCNGSCPAVPFEQTGNINRANPIDCYQRFLNETETHHDLH